MAEADLRAEFVRLVRDEAGSARISAALFTIAAVCAALVPALAATGLLVAPTLVYLIFGVIVLAAGWDLWRERRKHGGR